MVQEIGTPGLPALRSFSTVARLGGISAAAERLGIAKSGVSRHIAQLEAHFGVRLFERGARSVKLTPVGANFDLRVRSILAEVDQLGDIARAENAGVSGLVRIVATPEFGGQVAKTLCPAIKARHPDLRLAMRTGYAFEDMQDPGTDIAFRVGTFKDDRLVARQLGSFRAWVVASPELLQSYSVQAPEDLAEAPCLTFRGDSTTTTWTLFRQETRSMIDVSGPMAVQSFTALLDLAMAGHGIALLPEFMLDKALNSGALIRCLPEFTSRSFPVFLSYRPGARRVARIDAVITLAEETVPELLSS
ncbi:MAG: LysR family transcriptional regulator [Dinoroseobacter sp.]|nr:LysR family transcriptional regulator [Dinoroseobacter sp.]